MPGTLPALEHFAVGRQTIDSDFTRLAEAFTTSADGTAHVAAWGRWRRHVIGGGWLLHTPENEEPEVRVDTTLTRFLLVVWCLRN